MIITALSAPYSPVAVGTSTGTAHTILGQETSEISDQEYKYFEKIIESLKYQWEENPSDENLFVLSFDEIDKYNILHSFANCLLRESQDIDPSFAEVINEDFWDLI